MINTANKVLILTLIAGSVLSASLFAKDTEFGTTDTQHKLGPVFEPPHSDVLRGFDLHTDLLSDLSTNRPGLAAAHALNMTLDLRQPILSAEDAISLSLYGPWLTEDGISLNAQQLIRAIQDASVHGLNPQAYAQSSLLRTIDTLSTLESNNAHRNRFVSANFLADKSTLRSDLNAQLNTSFMKLIQHLGQGVIKGETVQQRLYRNAPVVDAPGFLSALATGKHSVSSALAAVTPSHREYVRLSRKMRDLLTEKAADVPRATVQPDGLLSDSQTVNDILSIQLRLIETGELPLSTELDTQWNDTLRAALLAFQQRHGIPETGTADSRTRTALNHTIQQEIEAIALSLERWRWMPRNMGQKHVFVNIPAYNVEVRDGLSTLLTMSAVVGSIQNPTPSFSRDMSYMDFNPTWTVPASIANAKLIPLERRKPGYLASRNFEYLQRQGGKLIHIPSEQVTEADFQKERFPYILRQRGGPDNALGRMKFMMPNPYAIYLHDTQSKQHFTLNNRAFSYGCIRLSEPGKLARLLMHEDGYSEDTISSALSTKNTRRIVLRTPVPTHLTYMTTWVDENEVLHRRNDIYSQDAALLNALKNSNTLLSILEPTPTDIAANGS